MPTVSAPAPAAVTADQLLKHWQGHRRLTRRTIDAFPDDKLFTFSVGGMRPFGELALEMLTMAEPMLHGLVTGEWDLSMSRDVSPKAEILRRWDKGTAHINALWSQIPPGRFQETVTAFGRYKDLVCNLLLYVIDNEIHHRGQGYVYLRALGIEPPPFYERD
ncbi:MAG TPA: DinB family protein [Gemmatimonadaceae bacterium]|jgi:uncharacterized damage-inducible protein DinB